MHRMLSVAALATMAFAPAAAAQEQSVENDAFTWNGTVAAGQWLTLRNLNGAIKVERASGNRVEVTATKRWRRGDPEQVRFEAKPVDGDRQGMLICALWDDEGRCDEHQYRAKGRSRSRDRDDVSVEFVVKLPAGVRLDISTVNGALRVEGAGAEVVAHTVNGGIDASTMRGPVRAETVNGSITVRMDQLSGTDEMEFSTVNGSVKVMLPASLDADIELSTVNGSLRTDYPVTVSGSLSPRRLRATIGKGGRPLRVKTVNGSIELRRLG